MSTLIYVLKDDLNRIRYVGKTSGSLAKRLAEHLWQSKTRHDHKSCWIRKLLAEHKCPIIMLIGEVEGNGCKEEIAYITYFKDEGYDLVNLTAGGEGVVGWKPTPETRAKMSAARKGRVASPETRAKLSIIQQNRPHHSATVETRAKMSAAQKGRIIALETREKLSIAMTGKKHSIETLAKISRAHIGMHAKPETCIKIRSSRLGKSRSLETRAKMSATRKGMRLSNATRAKISVAHQGRKLSDDHRTKISIARLGDKHPHVGAPRSYITRMKISTSLRTKYKNHKHK